MDDQLPADPKDEFARTRHHMVRVGRVLLVYVDALTVASRRIGDENLWIDDARERRNIRTPLRRVVADVVVVATPAFGADRQHVAARPVEGKTHVAGTIAWRSNTAPRATLGEDPATPGENNGMVRGRRSHSSRMKNDAGSTPDSRYVRSLSRWRVRSYRGDVEEPVGSCGNATG